MGGKLIFCATVWLFVLFSHTRAQDKCNLAKDLVVQARERIKVGTNDEAADGIQLLKHATEVCISSGDAWYYRSLFERKLGQAANADGAITSAQVYEEERNGTLKSISRLTQLYDLEKVFSSTLEMAELLPLIASKFWEILEAQAVNIWLLHPHETIELMRQVGPSVVAKEM
jgi:hypothetical protein